MSNCPTCGATQSTLILPSHIKAQQRKPTTYHSVGQYKQRWTFGEKTE